MQAIVQPAPRGIVRRYNGTLRGYPAPEDHERAVPHRSGERGAPEDARGTRRHGTVALQQPALALRPDRRKEDDRGDSAHQWRIYAPPYRGGHILEALPAIFQVLRRGDGGAPGRHTYRPTTEGLETFSASDLFRYRTGHYEPLRSPEDSGRGQPQARRKFSLAPRRLARQDRVPPRRTLGLLLGLRDGSGCGEHMARHDRARDGYPVRLYTDGAFREVGGDK